jgi:drug/metabolite transporter (DMT)-like permease
MVAAAFFFSLMSLFVKLAGARLPSSQIVFVRSAVSLVISYLLVRRAGVGMWGVRKSLLILRGLSGLSALMLFFYAVTKLPLADVTVLHFTNPVFTAILAALFLGESMGRSELLGLTLSLGGVLLVAQPSFIFGDAGARLDLVAVAAALVGSMFSSVAYTTVRKLRETDHALVIVFYFPLVATPGSIPVMAQHALWPTPTEWLLLLTIGIVTQVAQVFLTKGLHAERAGRAMSVSYVQILFAALWGLVVFGNVPGPLTIAGTVLVVFGTLLVARRPREVA